MQHEVRVHIDAPADIVWLVLSDVERWPDWTASVRSVRLLDPPLAVGSRVHIRQPKLPAVTWHVTHVDPGRSFTWRSRSPGADAHGRHTVIDNGDGSATAVVGITQTGPVGTLVALLARRLTKRYVALEAVGLKAHSEASAD